MEWLPVQASLMQRLFIAECKPRTRRPNKAFQPTVLALRGSARD
jgi:hypothetical protein